MSKGNSFHSSLYENENEIAKFSLKTRESEKKFPRKFESFHSENLMKNVQLIQFK